VLQCDTAEVIFVVLNSCSVKFKLTVSSKKKQNSKIPLMLITVIIWISVYSMLEVCHLGMRRKSVVCVVTSTLCDTAIVFHFTAETRNFSLLQSPDWLFGQTSLPVSGYR